MNESESFFGDPDPIFADKELLRVSHLPEGDRIIGRDQELQKLADAIKDAQRGGTPNNVLIYGKTGTGKSLCSKYITEVQGESPALQGCLLSTSHRLIFNSALDESRDGGGIDY